MMICYTIVTAMLFFAAFTYAFVNLKSIVYKECEEDITALGRQYATAVNRFTKGVENDTSALFTVNELPEYDPVKGGLSPADESELKNSTKEMLLKMSAGKTYVDFMIFYSDGSVIGKASSGTKAVLNTESYEYFNDQMKNGECWLFGLSGANRKIYYIRRLSDHSVLLLSEYIDELDKIINSKNGQKQIFILTDEQQRVIYTTADEKKLKHGDAIPKKYSSMFDAENEHVTVNGLTGAKLTTDSGWTAYTIMEQPSLIKISPIDGPSAMAMLLILVLISVATGTLATAKFMAGELADTNSEFIDPATGEVLPRGSEGELVVTTLTKEGMPVLRYRTKDITKINYEKCACGRTFARMDKPKGRSDDMLKIRGVNVFPSQIETVLMSFKEIAPHYQLVLTRENFADHLEIKVELLEQYSSLLDNFPALSELHAKITKEMKIVLGIQTKLTIVGCKTLERFQGKAKRIVDLRNQ